MLGYFEYNIFKSWFKPYDVVTKIGGVFYLEKPSSQKEYDEIIQERYVDSLEAIVADQLSVLEDVENVSEDVVTHLQQIKRRYEIVAEFKPKKLRSKK